MKSRSTIKGRGAQLNTPNKFFELSHEMRDDFLEYCYKEGEDPDKNKTRYLPIYPKTIYNNISMPAVGKMYSMNMYQRCEHDCVYCCARNTHELWGYSAAPGFEGLILV